MVKQYIKINIWKYFDYIFSKYQFLTFLNKKKTGNIVETDGLPDFLVTKTPILESNGAPKNRNPSYT